MNKIKEIWRNKWVRFTIVSVLYLLLFVVWTGNLWLLIGLPVIYDIYISKFMYRLFWHRHKELKKSNRTYKKSMEWVEAILFAVVVTSFIRFFWFAMYVIPTPSMEKSLLVGDYLAVSKIAYGPVVPNTPLAFPLVHNTMPLSATKKSYVEWIKWPYHRLRGLGNVKRGDVVVFNFPAGDTVVLQRQSESYYDILRAYEKGYGAKAGREKLYREYTVISRPVDKRENYVKRCIALPGDSLRIINGVVYVNGQSFEYIPGQAFNYIVQTTGTPINKQTLTDMGLAGRDVHYDSRTKNYYMTLTAENLKRVEGMSNVVSVEKPADNFAGLTFPHDQVRYPWSADNYGPLWVPRKGATVHLDLDNLPIYKTIIMNYELNELSIRDEVIYINGTPVDSYTFKMDYYFMMGDNRDNSADSRYWGFVPEDHVVGKASFIWLSLDEEKSFPSNIRWSRMFRSVK